MKYSDVKVIKISRRGIWLYVRGEMHFMSHDNFPPLKAADFNAKTEVKEVKRGLYRWPRLGMEVMLQTIRQPEKYPLPR